MNTNFQTDNILLASFLLTMKAPLMRVLQDKPRHFIFEFKDKDKCHQLNRDFLNNGIAPARELFSYRATLINEIKKQTFIGSQG